METYQLIKRSQVLVNAGEYGPVWRITERACRLERVNHDGLSLVRLDMPGYKSRACGNPTMAMAV